MPNVGSTANTSGFDEGHMRARVTLAASNRQAEDHQPEQVFGAKPRMSQVGRIAIGTAHHPSGSEVGKSEKIFEGIMREPARLPILF
jgi:hypothetical protein